MVDRSDLQRLAEERLADAQVLFAAGRYSGAFYLAGYAVECGLKACVAKLTTAESFPDKELADKVYTHNLKRLATAAELDAAIKQREKADPDFEVNWAFVNFWSEKSRYESWPDVMAKWMLDAVSNSAYGVLPWIRQYW